MLNSNELIKRITSVDRSECDAELCQEMDNWIKEIGELEALRAVSENFVIQDMIKRYRSEIELMDSILLTKRRLSENERECILDKKALYTDFVHSFDPVPRLEEIARNIEEL